MVISHISNIIQSINQSIKLSAITFNMDLVFLNTATPPRGIFELEILDGLIMKKPLGHFNKVTTSLFATNFSCNDSGGLRHSPSRPWPRAPLLKGPAPHRTSYFMEVHKVSFGFVLIKMLIAVLLDFFVVVVVFWYQLPTTRFDM